MAPLLKHIVVVLIKAIAGIIFYSKSKEVKRGNKLCALIFNGYGSYAYEGHFGCAYEGPCWSNIVRKEKREGEITSAFPF